MADFEFPEQFIHDGIQLRGNIHSLESVEAVKDFETSIDDVCIASYPKSGSHWIQQILVQMYPEICDADATLGINIAFIETDPKQFLNFPSAPFTTLCDLEAKKSPRLFRTHLPRKYFLSNVKENGLKVLFVVRNVKDVLVSYFHHYKDVGFPHDFHDFFKLYQAKKLLYSDFFELVQSWLDVIHLPNVLLLRYEDMKEDLLRELDRINQFCGRNLNKEQLEKIAKKCSLETMKNDPNVNYYGRLTIVRKGSIGEWVKYFTEEESQYVDSIIEKYPDYKKLYNIK